MKEIYIYIDDSGVMHHNDLIVSYGGIYFNSRAEKRETLLNTNKLQKRCEKELKNLSKYKKTKILKYLLTKNTFAIHIKNKSIFTEITNKTKARGRLKDYAIRIIVKEIIKKNIINNIINNKLPISINIFIDESTVISDSNRLLSEDIYKELKKGFKNQKYNIKFPEVITTNIIVNIKYVNSKNNIYIQYADLIVRYARNNYISKIKSDLNIEKKLF